MPQIIIPTPGFYQGPGQAFILDTNSQVTLLTTASRIGAGTPNLATIAVQLNRIKASSYPFGFAVEIAFNGAPGTFEVDIQGAETDTANNYCKLGTGVTAVNGSNVARFEGVSVYPKFVRVLFASMGNDVQANVVITR